MAEWSQLGVNRANIYDTGEPGLTRYLVMFNDRSIGFMNDATNNFSTDVIAARRLRPLISQLPCIWNDWYDAESVDPRLRVTKGL